MITEVHDRLTAHVS